MKKVSFYLFITLIAISCNSVKRVAENEHLLMSNTIYVNKKKNTNRVLNDYLLQKPNYRALLLPISLYFYNWGNINSPKTPKDWGIINPKKYHFFETVFSEKQSIAVAKYYIGLNNWFLRSGEAPVVIDDKKTERTVNNLKTYFMTQGYFRNTVTAKKDIFSNKKGRINYFIDRGESLYLDTITRQISSKVLDSIYKTEEENTFLKSGNQYKDKDFRKEATRLIKLYRNNGIYNFSENLIAFEADSTRADNKTNICLTISDNYLIGDDGKRIYKPFAVHKISKINVYTDYNYNKKNELYLDTIKYKGLNFIAHKKVKYNLKYLLQSIFIRPNQIYSDTLKSLTRSHLRSLKNFKAININYTVVENHNQLEVDIYLTQNEKYTTSTEIEFTHSNIRKLGISGKFSIVNRNTFRGAELFSFSFLGSFFNTSAQSGNSSGFFNTWEIGADISLEIPRFIAPFGANKLVPKKMYPKTLFSIGTRLQKNIGLDKQTITSTINYNWRFNKKKTVSLEFFNVQYIRNLNIGEYFSIYNSEFKKLQPLAKIYYDNPNYNLTKTDAVGFINLVNTDTNFKISNPIGYERNANINNRYNIITSNFIIPTIAYSLTYNSQVNYKDNKFSFFKIRVANSGNFISLLTNKKNNKGVKIISETPIAQYFKTDIEYKRFWDVTDSSVLGFRSSIGVVIPYGNSDIPFTKSYFAGGSNDIRAWQIYDLGPGSATTNLEYNVGSFKFLTNLEYRFNVIRNWKGAFFVDAGNIWDITNYDFIDRNAKLNGLSSIKQIALGSGFGIRYDFSFLVLRFDIGFKTYEPYLENNKWLKNFSFDKAVYNVGISYPF